MTQTETAGRTFLPDLPGVVASIVPRLASHRFAASAYRHAVTEALRHRQLRIAAALINNRHACRGYFKFALGSGEIYHNTVVHLHFRPGGCVLEISEQLNGRRLDFVSGRLIALLPLLTACREGMSGTVALNVDDYGVLPGLAFSDGRSDRFLIPDAIYLAEHAYRKTAEHYRNHDIAWEQRHKIAFWRGSTTGGELDCDVWWEMDRVRLCRIASEHPALFDAGLAGIVQLNEREKAQIVSSGLVRPFVPETEFNRYRYQIDIDGNTNSWPGLFQKLLTGSPVLKVASRHGFRQWYYDRLKAWENFVPVATNLSDLVEKVNWLRANDREARRIGAAGQALAQSMTVTAELKHARATIQAALAANAAQ